MIINYTNKELDLLARLMRSEALSEGELGMMMVGDVVINRVIASCYTFKDRRTITDVIYDKNQFLGINNSLFQGKPTKLEKRLAQNVLKGESYFPASNSLWFCATNKNNSCNSTWYSQELSGNYKKHCFYKPKNGVCKEIC